MGPEAQGARLLFFSSAGEHAGKTLMLWAMGRVLKQRGVSVGLVTPVCRKQMEDLPSCEDSNLLKTTLGLNEPIEDICLFLERPKGAEQVERVAQKLKAHIAKVAAGKDIVFVAGEAQVFIDDPSLPFSEIGLIKALGASLILIVRFQDLSKALYTMLSVGSLLGRQLKGIVLNRIPPGLLDELAQEILRRTRGLLQCGLFLVPEDPIIGYRRLGDIVEATGSHILVGTHRLRDPIGKWTLGGSGLLTGPLRPLRKLYNKILLLPPQFPESPTKPVISALILTQGRMPPRVLLQLADEMGISLMVSPHDTFVTLEKIESHAYSLSHEDEDRADRMAWWLNREGSLDRLWKSLGLIQA